METDKSNLLELELELEYLLQIKDKAIENLLNLAITPGAQVWVKDVLANLTLDEFFKFDTNFTNEDGFEHMDEFVEDSIPQPWEKVLFVLDQQILMPNKACAINVDCALKYYFKDQEFSYRIDLNDQVQFKNLCEVSRMLNWTEEYIQHVCLLEKDNTHWCGGKNNMQTALFKIDQVPFIAQFGLDENLCWEMGWVNLVQIEKGSGLFSQISQRLKTIVQTFLTQTDITELKILGSDQKRSDFYAYQCQDWGGDNFDAEPILSTDKKLVLGIKYTNKVISDELITDQSTSLKF